MAMTAMEWDMENQQLIRERFDSKWKRDANTGCWLWTASTAGKGYGQFRIPGTRKNIYAHRLSFELFKGALPKGAHIMHSCDTPRCVNPDHLSIGSPLENARDMRDKDRHLNGERNAKAKLTQEQVLAIKTLLAHSGLSQKTIAGLFGIKQMEVSRIKRGERWAHVAPELTLPSDPVVIRR